MKFIFTTLLLITMETQLIFDFNKTANINNWIVIDDVVMGGKSSGNFELNTEGNGVFSGDVSLENNGGFSSVKYKFSSINVQNAEQISLTIKGDGKTYQFRVKSRSVDRHSYIIRFATTGEWQKVKIPLNEMYPSFRGNKLDLPNFSENNMEEISFLIANKNAEHFKLVIDKIEVK